MTSDASPNQTPRWAALICLVAGVALFLLWGNATRGYVDSPSLFRWWISQWLNPRAETEHGWLILGLSAWVWWRNLQGREASLHAAPREIGARAEGNGVRGGCLGDTGLPFLPVAAMLAGLALHGIGFVAQQTRISIVAFLLFTWGVVAFADRRWGRAAAFPLAFLAFAIPLNVLDSLGFWLRLWVINVSGTLAHAVGIDVVRSGTQLFAPDGRFQYDVAAACSGVRSLMALAALSLLIGYLNFRTGWRRSVMFLLCFPLTYLGNLARICAIIVAAQIGGQRWGEQAHDIMGYGIFVIVLGGVLAAAGALKRWAPESQPGGGMAKGGSGSARRSSSGAAFRSSWWFCVALVVALATGEMAALSHVASSATRGQAGVRLTDDGKDPVALPAFIGTEWIGRRAEVTAVEREILPADTGFSRRNYVSIKAGDHAVFLSIVLSGRDRTSIHRPELCLIGQGWTIGSVGSHAFAAPTTATAIPATLLSLQMTEPRTNRKVAALAAYWFVSSDVVVASHGERILHDAWNRVRHGRADRWAYVLMQADAADGEAAALARMQEVLTGTLPVMGVPERR